MKEPNLLKSGWKEQKGYVKENLQKSGDASHRIFIPAYMYKISIGALEDNQ